MASIILPIKAKYVEAIFNGSKKFELRRKAPKHEVKIIYVYQTSPTSKIVGRLLIKETLKLTIKELWKQTKGQNSLTSKELQSYFKGLKYGFAFKIAKKERFASPRKIAKYNLSYPPQGFVYLKSE